MSDSKENKKKLDKLSHFNQKNLRILFEKKISRNLTRFEIIRLLKIN